MNSTQIIKDHPAQDKEMVSIPDFLLLPLIESAFEVIKKYEEAEIPTSLRRISHFDSKALNHSTARAQIIQSLLNNSEFMSRVEEEFFQRVEASIAFREWNATRALEIIEEASTRNDLPLLASMLWLKRPRQYEYALGQIVAHSSIAISENEQRDSQRADQSRLNHLETSVTREKNRADLLASDVERLEGELREERKSRRVKEQRQVAQVESLQKQIDQNDEVLDRLKESKERINQRLEREASRAHELESRLRIAQEDSKSKSQKIEQLQEQLASALSSDMELGYEDLQKLILAQQEAESISQTILKIMNKTRSILSQSSASPQTKSGSFEASKVEVESDGNSAQAVTLPAGSIKPSETKETKRVQVEIPQGMSLESDVALRKVFSQPDLVVLIDGYNVSLNSFGDLSLELQRERTVACATNIESRFHPSCVIVFDGQSSTTRGRVQSKVHVVFSPSGVTADDVIIERIQVTPKERPIVVVTSDRNLAARARGLGCQTISSSSFVSVAK